MTRAVDPAHGSQLDRFLVHSTGEVEGVVLSISAPSRPVKSATWNRGQDLQLMAYAQAKG